MSASSPRDGRGHRDDERWGYNGWPSYETWLVALWLGNDSGTDGLCRELVASAEGAYEAGEALKAYVEETSPLAEAAAGLHVDLLTAALAHVDWRAVARHFAPEASERGGGGRDAR